MKLIYKAKLTRPRERWQLIGLALVGLVDSAITLATLGYLATDLRSWYLFDFIYQD
jgi:hypothetical protein